MAKWLSRASPRHLLLWTMAPWLAVFLVGHVMLTNAVPTLEEKVDNGAFAAFMKLLNESAGKSVTIVVREEGHTNTFTFPLK